MRNAGWAKMWPSQPLFDVDQKVAARKAEMRSYLKTARSAPAVSPATPQLVTQAGGRYRLVRSLFARKATEDSVATKVHFHASPEAVWNRLMFFEEVPGRPPFILRLLLPHPVRSEGDKSDVGAAVQCTYKGGDLVKRITAVEPPFRLRFEVVEQRLGIEGCVRALSGSYQICRHGDGADVVLTTSYRAYLRPRLLWRPLEKILAGQLHCHILNEIGTTLPYPIAVPLPAAAE